MRYQKPIVEIVEDSVIETKITDVRNLSQSEKNNLLSNNTNISFNNKSKNMTFEEMIKEAEIEEMRLRGFGTNPKRVDNRNPNGYKTREEYRTMDGIGFNISIETDMDLF